MRKQLRNKRRSCGLCKPHKRGMSNRWKPREQSLADASRHEIEALTDVATTTQAPYGPCPGEPVSDHH